MSNLAKVTAGATVLGGATAAAVSTGVVAVATGAGATAGVAGTTVLAIAVGQGATAVGGLAFAAGSGASAAGTLLGIAAGSVGAALMPILAPAAVGVGILSAVVIGINSQSATPTQKRLIP